MYTVTAIYQDAEVGYGEGDSYEYAMQDCVDSIDSMYREFAADDVILCGLKKDATFGLIGVETPLSLWLSITA